MTDFQPTEPPGPEPTNIFEKKPHKDSTPKGATSGRGRPNKHNQRKEKLMTLLVALGSGVALLEQFDGMVIVNRAEDVAEATATLADEVPAVAKAIDGMSTGGAYGSFFLALMTMILPILAHHKILPPFIADALIPQDVTNVA